MKVLILTFVVIVYVFAFRALKLAKTADEQAEVDSSKGA